MPEPNFRNRTLFHGDNLKFLQAIDSGTVHLIATDPPFNKSRDFHATPDSLAAGGKFEDRWRYDKDVHPEWIDAIQDDNPAVWSVIDTANEIHKKRGKQKEDGSDMGAFLCYMGVRLMEMHRVLHEDGSLYLHCDATAGHYLKAICDAIFGYHQFRNEIIWKRTSAHSNALRYGSTHDVILYYSKSSEPIWNDIKVPYEQWYIDQYYRYKDEDERRFMSDNLTAPSQQNREGNPRFYAWNGVERVWRYSKERMAELDAEGRIFYTRNGVPRFKRYLDEQEGASLQDLWLDIEAVRSWHKEGYGYRTQKPLALYERIIRASSNEGDVVLDPFAGCATTVVAAELLNRQWIGMDIWDGAHKAVVQRLITVGKLSPSGVPDDMLADLAVPDQQGQLITFGELHYATTPPERTDDREIAVPAFELPPEYQKAKWERLSHAEIRAWLEPAQADGKNVICAGCGRRLPPRYMELDHIRPRASGGPNTIDNRVLMCGPCNREKKADLTMTGLWKKNRKDDRMEDETAARAAFEAAGRAAERARRTLR